MQHTRYHHANHLSQQSKNDVQQRDNDLITYIQTAIESSSKSDAGSITEATTPSDVSTMTPVQHQENATGSDPVQFEMLKLLQ